MLANKFQSQHQQFEKFGNEIKASEQAKVTLDLVAGAIAYHVAKACDVAQKGKKGDKDDKKTKDFVHKEAKKWVDQESNEKGLEWLDRKKVEQAAVALVEALL